MSRRTLRARLERVIEALEERGITHLVVACNAASTVLPEVQTSFPVVGVLPHASSALGRARGTVAVIGGARTIRSGMYRRALACPGRTIVQRIAQPLSAHIEAGTLHTPSGRADVARIMTPLAHVDALVLACTHYAAAATELLRFTPRARLIDPVQALVPWVARRWSLTPSEARDVFLTTGRAESLRAAASRAWGVHLEHALQISL
jgi:glutamate racemase